MKFLVIAVALLGSLQALLSSLDKEPIAASIYASGSLLTFALIAVVNAVEKKK